MAAKTIHQKLAGEARWMILVFLLAIYSAECALAADWANYQHDFQHTGRTSEYINPLSLQASWQAPPGYGNPLVVGDKVYMMREGSASYRKMAAFDLADGHEEWEVTPNTASLTQGFAYGEGMLAYANRPSQSSTGKLFVHDAETGALKYSVNIPGFLYSTPVIYRNPVTGTPTALVSGSGTFAAIQLGEHSGSVLWSQRGSNNLPWGSIPTIVEDSAIVAGSCHYYALNLSSGAMNEFHSGGCTGGGTDTPVYDSDRRQLYILESFGGSSARSLTAYSYQSFNSIQQVWQRTDSLYSNIDTSMGVTLGPSGELYSLGGGTILKMDPSNGSTLLTRPFAGASGGSPYRPIVSDGFLWTTSSYSKHNMYAYELSTLQLVSSLPSNGPNSVIANGRFISDSGLGPDSTQITTVYIPEPACAAFVLLSFCLLKKRRLGPPNRPTI